MAKIRASLADVSTEFPIYEPGVYEFEIVDVTEQEKDDEVVGYRVKSKIMTEGEYYGKPMSDFISLVKKNGDVNDIGLSQLRRYFELKLDKDEIDERGDDLDTDELKGVRFRGQIVIDSYTPEGASEPRRNNKFKAIERC